VQAAIGGQAAGNFYEQSSDRNFPIVVRLAPAFRRNIDAIKHITVDTFGEYMELNESFHAELVALAKSAMLRRSIEHVKTLPFASPSALVFARSKLPRAEKMIIVGQEQHHAILEAVERREGTRAEALAREHAQLSRRNLEISLADEQIRTYVPGSPLILSRG